MPIDRLRWSENSKVAILFPSCGLPGSGKTTLANRLQREFSALRLTADEWLFEIHPVFAQRLTAQRNAGPHLQLACPWHSAENLVRSLVSSLRAFVDRASLFATCRAWGWDLVLGVLAPARFKLASVCTHGFRVRAG
jgi:hypothetical protein